MNKGRQFERIYVAGHSGMVGSAILRRMQTLGLPAPITVAHGTLDLRVQADVRAFIAEARPTSIIAAAAKVGGIEANRSQPASFLYDNLSIAANVIDAAYNAGVPRLLYLGSSCIYPRLAPQPMPEEALQTGPLEPTNEGYAVAKIAGMKMCQMYRRQYGVCYHSAMPTNLYGPGDNYDPAGSHVLPALLRRFEDARERGDASVSLWGTGVALREFLHVVTGNCRLSRPGVNPTNWANAGSRTESWYPMARDGCSEMSERYRTARQNVANNTRANSSVLAVFRGAI